MENRPLNDEEKAAMLSQCYDGRVLPFMQSTVLTGIEAEQLFIQVLASLCFDGDYSRAEDAYNRATYLKYPGMICFCDKCKARRMEIHYQTEDHPTLNGRVPVSGEQINVLEIPVAGGKTLFLHMGEESFKTVVESISDAAEIRAAESCDKVKVNEP